MQYVKKMCILRQVKQGFSGDGKALSGLVKVEQYGKNLAVEVSVINFAPLSSGEYYCLLADRKGKTELLALRGKSLFNILTDMELENGFCAVICFAKQEITPIAYGINGDGKYDWKKLLASTLPPSFFKNKQKPQENLMEEEPAQAVEKIDDTQDVYGVYNDETLAEKDYYQEEQNGQELLQETIQNARIESAGEKQNEKARADATQNGNAENVLHPFALETDGYYLSVKTEIDELLQKYPKDDTLCGAFSCSEWVRVKGEENNPQYLVGIVYNGGKARYICYALATDSPHSPPEEIKDVCSFVPRSPFDEGKGFFIIFQSASSGECIKPVRS